MSASNVATLTSLLGLGASLAGQVPGLRRSSGERTLRDISRSGGAGAATARRMADQHARDALAVAQSGRSATPGLNLRQGLRAAQEAQLQGLDRAAGIAAREQQGALGSLMAAQQARRERIGQFAAMAGGAASAFGAQHLRNSRKNAAGAAAQAPLSQAQQQQKVGANQIGAPFAEPQTSADLAAIQMKDTFGDTPALGRADDLALLEPGMEDNYLMGTGDPRTGLVDIPPTMSESTSSALEGALGPVSSAVPDPGTQNPGAALRRDSRSTLRGILGRQPPQDQGPNYRAGGFAPPDQTVQAPQPSAPQPHISSYSGYVAARTPDEFRQWYLALSPEDKARANTDPAIVARIYSMTQGG